MLHYFVSSFRFYTFPLIVNGIIRLLMLYCHIQFFWYNTGSQWDALSTNSNVTVHSVVLVIQQRALCVCMYIDIYVYYIGRCVYVYVYYIYVYYIYMYIIYVYYIYNIHIYIYIHTQRPLLYI